MEPHEFREVVVVPDVEELKQNYGDIRAAYHAVASVDALAAHIFAWCKEHKPEAVAGIRDDSAYRQRLAQRNADFGLLRDIAKAHKHVLLDRNHPQVSGAKNVSVRELGWDEARWDEGRWDSAPQVVVQTNGGDFRVVEYLTAHALELLVQEMDRLGVTLACISGKVE